MDLLKKENVQIVESASDWKDAIRMAVLPLEQDGYVEPRYKEEIISNVEAMGPYIVLAPYIALPHARPEQGVLKSQIAVTLLRKEVYFENEKKPVKLLITLAASDNNSHLDALMTISELLQKEDTVENILNAENKECPMAYYLKAVIGARTNDSAAVLENLKKACALDASFKQLAATDMEFAKFFENNDFMSIVK